jgi:hypothetical protein
MGIDSYVVAEMLQRLEQQSAAIRPYVAEVAAAVGRDHYPAALEASAELHRLLDAFVATREALQDHVVANDGLGELGESLAELTLRARGMVLVAQLRLVRDALCDPAVQTRSLNWFSGRFGGIEQMTTFIQEQLTSIHGIWMPYRQDRPQPAGMTEAERVSVYRTVVRVAQRELCKLREVPDIARFLDRGGAATDVPEIHLACKRISIALTLETDAEAGRYRQHQPRRDRALHTSPGRANE